MNSNVTAIGLSVLVGIALSGCKTFPKGDMSPALLMQADASAESALATAAKEVLGRTNVQLGASDYKASPQISILPQRSNSPEGAPFNQQDFAKPTLLLLMTDGSNCFLVDEGTRKLAHVKGVECRPIG